MTSYPPEAWAREADRYQKISDERRAAAEDRRQHKMEIACVVIVLALILVLVLGVRL